MENFTIDRAKKSFVFDDGEVIPIPKDKEKQVLRSPAAQKSKKESVEKWKEWEGNVPLGETGHTFLNTVSENVFGNLGDTLANYGVSAIKSFSPGEGQEEMGYVDRVLDHFYAMQEGRKEHLSGLQEKHPTAKALGTGVGILGELGTLVGSPAAVALPAMGAGQSETSFLEPVEKSKEIAKDAVTGLVLDKFFKGVSKIAGHRETQRGVKNLITSTEEKNLGEIQRAAGATEADKLRFANQTASREAELQRLSGAQQLENQAFVQGGENAVNRIVKTMGKTPISAEILGVEDFINSAINTSAHAATSEANYVSKFLRSVFKGDKAAKLSGESLKKGVNALDEAILKSEGAAKQLLSEYKSYLSKALPDRLASSYVFEKWAPKISSATEGFEKNLDKIFTGSPEINDTLVQRLGAGYSKNLNQEIKKTIEEVLGGYKNNFQALDPALVGQEVSQAIRASKPYQKLMKQVDVMFPELKKKDAFKTFPHYEAVHNAVEKYPDLLAQKVSKNIDKYLPDIGLDFSTKGGVTQSALEKAPLAPNILPPPAPVSPARAVAPNLTPVPQVQAPNGVYEKLASGLESFRNTGPKEAVAAVKQNAPAALIAKMAGIPLTKVALGAGTAATGARALTSPSMAGQVLRTGLEQGARGLYQMVDQRAQSYPSYHDGILDNPQDRRSLTKEIEDDQDIPIEQKALIQSKINRGKPVQGKL